MEYKVQFIDGNFVDVNSGSNLSEVLNIQNSPILFGCRTGICGTCLVDVKNGVENLSPLGEDEKEYLQITSEKRPNARLACQLFIKGEIELEYLGKN